MPKATDPKSCIKCEIALNSMNWAQDQRANYINKCRACIKAEKRIYAAQWRGRNKDKSLVNLAKYKANLKKNDPIKARAISAYGDSRKRAIKRGMPFDLTPKFVLAIMRQATICPYFGLPLTFGSGKGKMLASIDRIDSAKGYTMDNVRVISYLANLMKSHATESELTAFAHGILGTMRTWEKTKDAESKR